MPKMQLTWPGKAGAPNQESVKITEIDTNTPGYSAKFINFLNDHPNLVSLDMRGAIIKLKERPEAAARAEGIRDLPEEDKVLTEAKALAGYFIPEIWSTILETKKKAKTDFFDPGTSGIGTSTPLGEEIVKEKIRNLDFLKRSVLVQGLSEYMENFVVDGWVQKNEADISQTSLNKLPHRSKVFKRLKDVLHQRIVLFVKSENPADIILPVDDHMKKVLKQARDIVWTMMRTACKKCHEEFDGKLTEEEINTKIKEALNSTRSIVFSIAGSHPLIAVPLIACFNDSGQFGNDKGYKTQYFKLIEHPVSKKISFELNPDVLQSIAEGFSRIGKPSNPKVKCPAVLSTDDSNRNIVSSYFDNNMEMFIKYCLD